MKTIKVGDIMAVLPPGIQEVILAILNRDEDDFVKVAKLTAILRQYDTELKRIGILPDYLAYALIYVIQNQARQVLVRNN